MVFFYWNCIVTTCKFKFILFAQARVVLVKPFTLIMKRFTTLRPSQEIETTFMDSRLNYTARDIVSYSSLLGVLSSVWVSEISWIIIILVSEIRFLE